jgi:hypothetical protein
MGLKEGVHFTVKMPEEGRNGYVYIRREGLAYAARLSVRGEGEQRELAADFVEYILQRAKEEGDDVYEKAKEIVKGGKERGSLKLKGEMEVEVNGKKYKVKVRGGEAVEEDRGGRKLLRIRITAEVGGVRRNYEITYGRYGKDNAAVGRAYASAKAPGGREADAERFTAVIKAITGKEPKVYQRSDGKIEIVCGGEHLDGFARYARTRRRHREVAGGDKPPVGRGLITAEKVGMDEGFLNALEIRSVSLGRSFHRSLHLTSTTIRSPRPSSPPSPAPPSPTAWVGSC